MITSGAHALMVRTTPQRGEHTHNACAILNAHARAHIYLYTHKACMHSIKHKAHRTHTNHTTAQTPTHARICKRVLEAQAVVSSHHAKHDTDTGTGTGRHRHGHGQDTVDTQSHA